ncbi:hypothetical protein L227DRAFT_438597 [Lentinus tigrinus ALCF2SS1-6]|uniref:Uncharacterized protein n=1 Tax=Lentinus tigrinus ALCF2SS1-6 TaxID=1328759 RepID=A0A5C2SIA1_9APHY|nr:hypothetical protein L227DRAFT_438597 [Lentinus tigrinus ALCF2SS1-6]
MVVLYIGRTRVCTAPPGSFGNGHHYTYVMAGGRTKQAGTYHQIVSVPRLNASQAYYIHSESRAYFFLLDSIPCGRICVVEVAVEVKSQWLPTEALALPKIHSFEFLLGDLEHQGTSQAQHIYSSVTDTSSRNDSRRRRRPHSALDCYTKHVHSAQTQSTETEVTETEPDTSYETQNREPGHETRDTEKQNTSGTPARSTVTQIVDATGGPGQ